MELNYLEQTPTVEEYIVICLRHELHFIIETFLASSKM